MTLKEAQSTVDQWIRSYGQRYFNELTNTVLLMEEVGELARLMARQYGEQSLNHLRRIKTCQKRWQIYFLSWYALPIKPGLI